MNLFDQLLKKSSRLDHRVKDKSERCKEKIYDIYDENLLFTTKEKPTSTFLSRSTRSLCQDVPTFHLKGRWDLKIGDEYDFLVKETENLKRRNGNKKNWATTGECNLPLLDFESDCELLLETNATSVKNWFQKRFNAIPKPSKHTAHIVTEGFDNLLKEKYDLDHQVKEKKKRCDQTIETETSNIGGNETKFAARSFLLM
jgi:hypothetical protein